MHPESEIAAEFWAYVNERGHGDSLGVFPAPPALMAELERQYWTIRDIKGENTEELRDYVVPTPDGPEAWVDLNPDDLDCRRLPPIGFPTLQAALYDYLLAAVGDVLIGNSYDVWQLVVVHVLASAVRDPSRLTVPVRERTGDRWVYDRSHAEPHTMFISDDWSILRRETFDFAVRNYERNG